MASAPPFFDFFHDIMHTFGFHLLYFTPNAVACMALFAHLREGFAGVHPNTTLFRHYFSPQIQKGGAITGCIAWIPRAKGAYPDDATQGCQNRDSIIRFYDFTIQTNPYDSTTLVHRI